jgi:hypothetical protein
MMKKEELQEIKCLRAVLERILRVMDEGLFVDYQMEKFGQINYDKQALIDSSKESTESGKVTTWVKSMIGIIRIVDIAVMNTKPSIIMKIIPKFALAVGTQKIGKKEEQQTANFAKYIQYVMNRWKVAILHIVKRVFTSNYLFQQKYQLFERKRQQNERLLPTPQRMR